MASSPHILLLALFLPMVAHAQQPNPAATKPHGQQTAQTDQPPTHQPKPVFPPQAALAHLRAGNLRWSRLEPEALPSAATQPRPGGAGRYLAAVILCCDADVDPAALFSCNRSDLLIVSNPGPTIDAGVTATLERLTSKERLSLCVILTHSGCESLTTSTTNSTAMRAMQRRAQLTRQHAQARGYSVEEAQARLQREQLLGGSNVLRKLAAQGRLRVAPGSLVAHRKLVRWHTTRADEAHIAPVK